MYRAVAVLAPYQTVPKVGRKVQDRRVNTLDTDPDYIAFLTAIENDANTPILPAPPDENVPKISNLLVAMKKKQEQNKKKPEKEKAPTRGGKYGRRGDRETKKNRNEPASRIETVSEIANGRQPTSKHKKSKGIY
eukprot:Platyproteum_vivax@DN15110_c0_g1_i1.p1